MPSIIGVNVSFLFGNILKYERGIYIAGNYYFSFGGHTSNNKDES